MESFVKFLKEQCVLVVCIVSFFLLTITGLYLHSRYLSGPKTFDTGFGYVPPDPVPPLTDGHALGIIRESTTNGLIVHAASMERRVFYDMFPLEALQYALNVNQTWFWGDGQSSLKGYAVHTYANPGEYPVVLLTEISFRGGETKAIRATANVAVRDWQGSENIVDDLSSIPDNLECIAGSPVFHELDITFQNTGTRDIIINVSLLSTETQLPMPYWCCIEPERALLSAGGPPVPFKITIDCSQTSVGDSCSFGVHYQKEYTVRGWYALYNTNGV